MSDQQRFADYAKDANKKLSEYLAKVGWDYRCEVCGQNDWASNESLMTFMIVKYDGIEMETMPERSHPSPALHCTTCGNTKIFSLNIFY